MELIDNFYNEWFNNHDWWFSKNYKYDEYITQTYSILLESKSLSIAKPLQTILVYDQLPRHIYRNEYASHIIQYYLEKSLSVVKQYIHSDYYDKLTPIEWTFFMLPLRHAKKTEYILRVLEETWKKIENDKDNIQIYKRFLKATYKRFLSDNINQVYLLDAIPLSQCSDINSDTYKSILFFSPERYVSPCDIKFHCISFDHTIIDTTQPIIISLSGGVDSMICSLLIKKHFSDNNIIALHISYDNRQECDKEVIFLKHWCYHLKIPLFVRKISEIHRKQCMQYELRDLYESYTRDVRYNCYKSVTQDDTQDEIPQVIMGHNQSDILENIMTNIAHKNKYDNLYGMTPICIQDNIKFVRPLLKTSKEDIINFAHTNNIPYLPNSTPIWSQRGQIRNNIIPILDKWDKNFVPSLFSLSDTMTSLYNIMQNTVHQFVNKGIFNKTNDVFIINNVSINELVEENIYWKEVFNKIYNIHPSSKSIENFIFNLQKYKSSFEEFRCKHKKKIMITKNIVFEIKKISDKYVNININNIQK
jgi:tRNA(Ile)-lysidine synthetase-like protein